MKKLLVAGLMAVAATAFAQSSSTSSPSTTGTPPANPSAAPSYGGGAAGGGNSNNAASMGKDSTGKGSMAGDQKSGMKHDSKSQHKSGSMKNDK